MIIDLDTLFPVRKTFTDIVSYCTDPFASVESKVFASLPADVECGDLITALALNMNQEMISMLL